MKRLIRLLILAAGLALAGPVLAQAVRAPHDFTDDMIHTLATDPAAADITSSRQIALLDASRASPRDPRRAAALWVRAQAQFRLGNAVAAEQWLTRAEAASAPGREGTRLRAQAALLRGLIVRSNGDFGGALQHYRQAQRGFIAVGDNRGQALALQAVGILYSDAGDSTNALRYLNLAAGAYEGDDLFRLSLSNNLGVALQNADEWAASAREFAKALTIAENVGMDAFTVRIRLNLVWSQIASGDLAAAQQTLNSLVRDSSHLSDVERREMFQLRAVIAREHGQMDEARTFIDQSLKGLDITQTPTPFRKIHASAYEIYRDTGQAAAALAQLQAVRRLELQQEQLTASNRASLLAAQFQFSAQNARIDRLTAERLARDIAYQRTMTLVLGGGGAFALAMLGALLVQALRARNRARRDGDELREVNDRLERALAAKTEFLASTSHELRTPLNGILGMTQIMLTDSAMPPRTRSQVELLHDAGSTMRSLVDDILDAAKAEHGRFVISPKPSDPRAIAERVIALFAEQSQQQGIALNLNVTLPDQPVMIDPERVNQILFNLVGNALKFTHEGHIDVLLNKEGVEDTAALIIAVRDTGIGIAPEWQDSVFDMFKQVDNTRTRNYGGTGLGLAICRQLARAMGGDITLESAEGQGSCFTVRIPWQAAPGTAAPAVAQDVDDQPSICEGQQPGAIQPPPVADAAQSAIQAPRSWSDTASGPCILVISGAPLRASMLSAIVRTAGHTPVVAHDADGLEARISAGMACLIDADSLQFATQLAGDALHSAQGAIIVAGEVDGQAMELGRRRQAIAVPFTRNAIAAAITQCESMATSVNDSGLHAAPNGLSRVDTPPAQRRTA